MILKVLFYLNCWLLQMSKRNCWIAVTQMYMNLFKAKIIVEWLQLDRIPGVGNEVTLHC